MEHKSAETRALPVPASRLSRLGKVGHEVVDKIIETLETALIPPEQNKQLL